MCIFRHNWKVQSVYHYRSKPRWQKSDNWLDETDVLLVCQDCGEVKTESLQGKWSLEDFNKK